MPAARYVKLPPTVHAFRWTEDNLDDVLHVTGAQYRWDEQHNCGVIDLNGKVVSCGWWIVYEESSTRFEYVNVRAMRDADFRYEYVRVPG